MTNLGPTQNATFGSEERFRMLSQRDQALKLTPRTFASMTRSRLQ